MNAEKQKLLLVDDDRVLRERLAMAFERRGLEVCMAESVAMARECIAHQQFDYSVIDLQLGDGRGTDLIEALMASSPKVRLLILTGYGTIGTAVEAVKKGALEYLTKPTNPDAILNALRSESVREELPEDSPTLAQVEWEHMHRVLDSHGGNVSKAAKSLGIHRRSLQRKLLKHPGKLS